MGLKKEYLYWRGRRYLKQPPLLVEGNHFVFSKCCRVEGLRCASGYSTRFLRKVGMIRMGGRIRVKLDKNWRDLIKSLSGFIYTIGGNDLWGEE